MWSYSVNHMLHGAVARIGGAIKRIEGADGAKYSVYNLISSFEFYGCCVVFTLHIEDDRIY